ncbi:MAG: hypothetical protein KAJ51_05900 [Thermoplasmata archaeon]|nr:hypothetical protein [Thermoplasmata archaeon]
MVEETEEDRKLLKELEDKILDTMKKAIADGILTKEEKENIERLTKQLHEVVEGDGVITESEEAVLKKVETTSKLILKIEDEYLKKCMPMLKKLSD